MSDACGKHQKNLATCCRSQRYNQLQRGRHVAIHGRRQESLARIAEEGNLAAALREARSQAQATGSSQGHEAPTTLQQQRQAWAAKLEGLRESERAGTGKGGEPLSADAARQVRAEKGRLKALIRSTGKLAR